MIADEFKDKFVFNSAIKSGFKKENSYFIKILLHRQAVLITVCHPMGATEQSSIHLHQITCAWFKKKHKNHHQLPNGCWCPFREKGEQEGSLDPDLKFQMLLATISVQLQFCPNYRRQGSLGGAKVWAGMTNWDELHLCDYRNTIIYAAPRLSSTVVFHTLAWTSFPVFIVSSLSPWVYQALLYWSQTLLYCLELTSKE